MTTQPNVLWLVTLKNGEEIFVDAPKRSDAMRFARLWLLNAPVKSVQRVINGRAL